MTTVTVNIPAHAMAFGIEGFRITGDYHFGSGIAHSSWVGAGVMTTEDPSRLLMALMPATEAASFTVKMPL